jgi:hypothetical protein
MPVTASGDTCVYVVGMHRSGTSAITGLLCHLGLGAPYEEDQPRASKMNARGFFESLSLCKFDEALLEHLGGSWLAPPTLGPRWWEDESLSELKSEGSALFDAAFGERPIAWKDPRSIIVLPFWNSFIRGPVAAVLVYRDPFEVASSLEVRNKFRLTHGFALWERYMRAASVNLDGIPTFVTSYASLLSSPDTKCDELLAFLGDVSVKVDPTLKASAIEFLDTSLRHERTESAVRVEIPHSTEAVFRAFEAIGGPHFPWTPLDLEPEPDWVADTLASRRDLQLLSERYAALKASRPMRIARSALEVRDSAETSVRKLARETGLTRLLRRFRHR